MSAENVETVRRGYAHVIATGELLKEIIHPDFVWDMSTFRSWPEQQTYDGIEGARQFLADWTSAWEDWRLDLKELGVLRDVKGRIAGPFPRGLKPGAANPPATASLPLGHCAIGVPFSPGFSLTLLDAVLRAATATAASATNAPMPAAKAIHFVHPRR